MWLSVVNSPTRLVQWTRRLPLCLHLFVSGGAPPTSSVKHMRRSPPILGALCLALVVAGCAAPEHRPEAQRANFVFASDDTTDCWRSVRLDYMQICKKFAADQKVSFDFAGTHSHLLILQDGTLVFARVMFDKGPGTDVFTLDIDSSGNVIRSYPVHTGD